MIKSQLKRTYQTLEPQPQNITKISIPDDKLLNRYLRKYIPVRFSIDTVSRETTNCDISEQSIGYIATSTQESFTRG